MLYHTWFPRRHTHSQEPQSTHFHFPPQLISQEALANETKESLYAGDVYIACIEEIAWRNGWISDKELKEIGTELKQTEYGKYILSLLEER